MNPNDRDLRLLCVLAHPDDESLGTGGLLARCARDGIATYVVTATRGERGRFGNQIEPVAPDIVGAAREAELRAAAAELGVRDVAVLGYPDGQLDGVEPFVAIAHIAEHVHRVKPHVVVTFGPDGAYGHPDHIAISQFTTAAVMRAAHEGWQVSKLYFIAWSEAKWSLYQKALRRLVARVDGVERQAVPWPDWAITTEIDAGDAWQVVWRAVSHHKTQMSIYAGLGELPESDQRALWGTQAFYRVFSTVNGGRGKESDVFEGLR